MGRRSVLFISKGEQASSTRYRALNYFPLLRDHGWEPRHLTDDKTSASQRSILQAAVDADAVVLLRRTPGWLYGLRLRRASRLLVFDFDDAIFIPGGQTPALPGIPAWNDLADQALAGCLLEAVSGHGSPAGLAGKTAVG